MPNKSTASGLSGSCTRASRTTPWHGAWWTLSRPCPPRIGAVLGRAVAEQVRDGRPRCNDYEALPGIVFVLGSDSPCEMLPREFGLLRLDMCWCRLRDWQTAGVWAALHRALLERFADSDRLDWSRASLDSASIPVRKGRCDRAGPDSSRQIGHTKHRLVVDRGGTPLGLTLSGANHRDNRMLAPSLDAIAGREKGDTPASSTPTEPTIPAGAAPSAAPAPSRPIAPAATWTVPRSSAATAGSWSAHMPG